MSDDVELRVIVGEVAAAYFSNCHVTLSEIPTVINHIAASLQAVDPPAKEAGPETPEKSPEQPKLTPAQIRRSITRDALISFEDNRPYKTLRRHLAAKGLTPDAYRAKWGLPADYPMTAPSYSEARSTMAKAVGFGVRAARPKLEAQSPPAPRARPQTAAAAAAAAAPKTRRRAEPRAEPRPKAKASEAG